MHHPVSGINSLIHSVSLASHVSTHLLIHLSVHLCYHHHSHHPSLLHSFTPCSKPTFSTNLSHLRLLLPTFYLPFTYRTAFMTTGLDAIVSVLRSARVLKTAQQTHTSTEKTTDLRRPITPVICRPNCNV